MLSKERQVKEDWDKLKNALQVLKLEAYEGSSYYTLSCPFAKTRLAHKDGIDEHPSFVIWPKYNLAKCFCCGLKFEVKEFLTEYANYSNNPVDLDNLNFVVPFIESEEEENVNLNEAILDVFVQDDTTVQDYFNSRKNKIDITNIPLKFLYDNRKKRVVLPIRDAYNNLVGAVGRAILPNVFKTYNYFGVKTSKCLVGFEHRNADNAIIVVEGITDMANAYDKVARLGLKYDVYSTLTASLSQWQANHLVDECRPIFMAYDGDEAGRRGQFNALKLLDSLGASCLVNVTLEDNKDVGDLDYDAFLSIFN